MSIKRVKADTKISAGQWINKASLFTDAICGHAREVVKSSASRVYYKTVEGEDNGDYCSKSSIAFVSDTKDEALALKSVSDMQAAAMQKARKDVLTTHRASIEQLIHNHPAAEAFIAASTKKTEGA